MKSFSGVCSVCGTVNQAGQVRCVTCGFPLSTHSEGMVLTAAPPISPPNKVLRRRYHIVKVIGKGGMGTVYVGNDMHLGNRLVAIKEMSQNRLSPAERLIAAKNFQREAHLLARLQHPHLPSIYDHFEEDQRWYLVMSFVDGETLAHYLATKNGTLPVKEVLEIGIALCNVLHYLHSHQPSIIFRDLKPSNIMRTPDGHIYLIDFGVARFFKPGQMQDTSNYGTSGYAAPEQYGTAQTTPRSDIYSLGVTLHQMLSGYEPARTPFHLPPLHLFGSTNLTPLTTLITRMLDLDERRRPQSAEDVKEDLQKILNDVNITSPLLTPVSSALLPSISLKRFRGIFAVLIALSIVIAFSIIYPLLTKSNVQKANYTNVLVNTHEINYTDRVVNTYCNAMNSSAPDFQTAYHQFSSNYQRKHSLFQFEEYFQGATQCTVSSPANGSNQAVVSLTMLCPYGPPPGPNGQPPPDGTPLPDGRPPPRPVKAPTNLTLIHDGSNGWRIDTIYVVGYICRLPPNVTPSNQP